MTETEIFLSSHGIRPTAVRILVWREAERQVSTFSLNDMEELLPHMDRSSIFRALRLFLDHHLLHEINDGTGHQKFCVCRCKDGHHRGHIHFNCLKCGRTYCLEDYDIPQVDLPEGFTVEEVEYIVKGRCKYCKDSVISEE